MPAESSNSFMFDTMAIVGVGLIGGSLGMAAKKHKLVRKVLGIGRSEQRLMRAKILGAIDDYSLDFAKGAADADVVFVCTPVKSIVPFIAGMGANLKRGVIVTDVGSTKREIVNGAAAVMPDGRFFVGGHPMAGSEQAGVDTAVPDLFLGATYVLTHSTDTNLEALGKMTAFAEAIGAVVEVMTPEQHDEAVAVISHLPHTMAAALLGAAEDSQRVTGKAFRLAAGSFRDLTRISDSSPQLWRDICETNADALSKAIDAFCTHLLEFKMALESRDEEALMRLFEEAKQIRQTYLRIAK